MLSTVVSQLSEHLRHIIRPDYREHCAAIWSELEQELGQTARFRGLQSLYCEQQQQREWGKQQIDVYW